METCFIRHDAGLRRCLGVLIVCAATVACGMKGPPLPPLLRVPASPDGVSVVRYDREVYISYTVPRTNVEGTGAATIDRIEVWAITLEEALGSREAQSEALRNVATLVAREHVRIPPPLPEPDKPPPPPMPLEPGLDQGGVAVAREVLDQDALPAVPLPVVLTAAAAQAQTTPGQTAPTGPTSPSGQTTPSGQSPPPGATAPTGPTAPTGSPTMPVFDENVPMAAPTFVADDSKLPKRYYFVVGVTRGGRYGRTSGPIAIPLGPVTGATSAPTVTYDEKTTTIKWTPSPDAHVNPEAAGDLLPSRPLLPVAPPTTYEVFAVSRTPPTADAAPIAPAPLNPEPLTATELVVPAVRFGVERCFAVRPVDTVAGVAVRGPLSAPSCDTPRDTFPPAAPQQLAAIAGAANISLIWEPNAEPDLAGYIVLRGDVSSERLTPLTPSPIKETTFRDTNVQPGMRYVYAIVAVDNASPQNVSGQSARVEETARQ